MTARHTCRRRVDFPPIFGPVRSIKGACCSPPRFTSFGTNEYPAARAAPAVGWRRPLAQNQGVCWPPSAEKVGVHVGPSACKLAAEMLISASTSACMHAFVQLVQLINCPHTDCTSTQIWDLAHISTSCKKMLTDIFAEN